MPRSRRFRWWLPLYWLWVMVRECGRWVGRFCSLTWRKRSGKIGGAHYGLMMCALGFGIGCLTMWITSQAPVVRQVLYGDMGPLPKPVTPPPPGTAWVQVLTTGYCACSICCGADADGITARGRRVDQHPFGIASDPKLVTPWLTLDIPGYGQAKVDDTGGAMRQSGRVGIVHLDLRFKTHQTARQWGRRWLWIAMPAGAPASQLPPPKITKDS